MTDIQKEIDHYLNMPMDRGYMIHAEPVQRVIRHQQELIEQLQHRDKVVSLTNETLGRYVREAREELERMKSQKEVALKSHRHLEELIEQKEAEIEEWKKEALLQSMLYTKRVSVNDQQAEEIRKMREVLEKYGDMIVLDSEDHPHDVGLLARQALSQLTPIKGESNE